MDAPFHRFDLLISHTPTALLGILAAFADAAITPASVTTRQYRTIDPGNSLQSVTIILRQLADGEARAIEKRLKRSTQVRSVSVEHMLI